MSDNDIIGAAPEESSPPEQLLPPRQNPLVRFFDGNPVGRFLKKHRWGFLIFFLPVALMYFIYIIFGVHPFGDMSVLVLDLNGQYVSYYEAFRDAIWGDGRVGHGYF